MRMIIVEGPIDPFVCNCSRYSVYLLYWYKSKDTDVLLKGPKDPF